ncbi:septal ring lytic transglycosylase RlpA family protein [Rhizosaccharibacter radicis]|uniref:Endolytic peptidoglycan transglycosylase RlpA n=1 Tax=Rhizosaccharibacter radicis TaxID=2782605 RepID=A0ABT1W002_9PROT|nr:hypothetical protein [Acetobacteraceae bacterium KSS12]
MIRSWCGLACLLAAAGCTHKAPPAPRAVAHYELGSPWQGAAGSWFYPRESFTYEATGLATGYSPPAHGGLAADGERVGAADPVGSHQTLQLPCYLFVTNLDTGLRARIRIVDRGPADPGRILGLSPSAVRLLGGRPGQPMRVALQEDEDTSRRAVAALAGTPALALQAAPVAQVQQQDLPPPGGTMEPLSRPDASPPAMAEPGIAAFVPPPVGVERVPARATELWIDAGHFSERRFADAVAASIGGEVETEGVGRSRSFSVRGGPWGNVPAADAALDRARRAGVTGARIIVE